MECINVINLSDFKSEQIYPIVYDLTVKIYRKLYPLAKTGIQKAHLILFRTSQLDITPSVLVLELRLESVSHHFKF